MKKHENSETFHVTEELRHRSNASTVVLAEYCCSNKTCSELLWDLIKELSRHREISEAQRLHLICEEITWNVLRVYEPEAEALHSELLKDLLFDAIENANVFELAEMLYLEYNELVGLEIICLN